MYLLGAHLCGYAGYYLQKDFSLTLGRITGLDPAEPLFGDTDPIVRLDRNDANFGIFDYPFFFNFGVYQYISIPFSGCRSHRLPAFH